MERRRSASRRLAAAFVLVGGVYAVAAGSAAPEKKTTSQQRLDAIHHAQIWKETDVAAMNMRTGPRGPLAFAPNESVTCNYLQRPHGSGSTLKFACTRPNGDELKVRYGKDNGEVYGHVAASRLLWALGFYANRMYPVKVTCVGCPPDPFKDPKGTPRAKQTTFDPATIDVKLDGDTIETKPEEGWAWDELDQISEQAGGASKTQRDALTLLGVLIQHSSNKAINQRIVCVDPPKCSQTVMMISDLGKTFGRASAFNKDRISSVNFAEWSRLPVWNNEHGCVGNLPHSWSGTMHDPQVGEAGRKFLADLLLKLTDQQLHDMFEVARFTERDPSATIDQWVGAFKHKRDEIVNRHCS